MEKRQLGTDITNLPDREVSTVTEFRKPSSRLGENNPTSGRTHSDEARQKIRVANLGENNPMYGRTHSDEAREKIRAAQLGENNNMYGRRHSDETKRRIRASQQAMKADLGKNDSAQTREALRQAWTTYFELPYGNAGRELLALRHGFGIYQRHSSRRIGPVCARSHNWVLDNLERVAAGRSVAGPTLKFRIPDESLKPLFRAVDQLDIRQLQKLADLMYKFGPQELEMIVRLFGLGDRSPQPVAETNRQLFQATPWGGQRIRGFKRAVEARIYSSDQSTELANGPTRRDKIHRVQPDQM